MPDLSAQISEARAQGYNDAQIAGYLAQNRADLAPKITEALHAGHSAADVVNYLGVSRPSPAAPAAAANPPAAAGAARIGHRHERLRRARGDQRPTDVAGGRASL